MNVEGFDVPSHEFDGVIRYYAAATFEEAEMTIPIFPFLTEHPRNRLDVGNLF